MKPPILTVKVQPGAKFWSGFFKTILTVTKYEDDNNWYFKEEHGLVYKAQCKPHEVYWLCEKSSLQSLTV